MSRELWIAAAARVIDGDWNGIRCPENDDDYLDIEWIPGPMSGFGEYRLRCPSCGVENWVRET